MVFFSGLVITSYIFDFSEIFGFLFSKDIQLLNHMVFCYIGSKFTFFFYIKSTMHEAYPYSLMVYMVLHCVNFLWLFL